MRLGLFHKLMFTYLAVAIITVTTLGVAFHRLLINYTIEAKQGELMKEGIQLNQIAASYLISGQDRRSLVFLLSLLDRFSGARVWVVDKTGLILLASQDTGFARGHMFSVQGLRLSPEETRQVLEGETIRQTGQNPYFNELMLTVAVPVTTGGGLGSGEVLGAIFLNAPLTGTTETVKTLLKYLGWAALVAAVISTLLGVYLSRKISRPLREMRQAALAMAGGDYGSRIKVQSGDEVGELALAFNNMASQAERVEQMRREFVANASHELRTPLTVIRGYNDALMDDVISGPDKRNSYHLVIRDETIRLERLVRDLLDLSRLQSGKVEAGMEPLDAKGVIVATAAKMAEAAKARDVTIQLHVHDDMPETMGNEDWLTQLLIILLDNAINFSPPGGVVTIKAAAKEHELWISVADQGEGIPEEHLPFIWERFYKVDKSRTRSETGTGLGLAIAWEIVKLHHGSIWVGSNPRQGTTFTFSLPNARGI